MKNKPILVTIIILTLIGIVLYIYGNRYTFSSAGDDLVYKLDRFTGKTWLVTAIGESPISNSAKKRKKKAKTDEPIALPESELHKLEGKASIDYFGCINCNIYNGSGYRITDLQIMVQVKDRSGKEILNRIYNTTRGSILGGKVLENSTFKADANLKIETGQTWTWGIVSAYGNKNDYP
jgi:hypothetical protein